MWPATTLARPSAPSCDSSGNRRCVAGRDAGAGAPPTGRRGSVRVQLRIQREGHQKRLENEAQGLALLAQLEQQQTELKTRMDTLRKEKKAAKAAKEAAEGAESTAKAQFKAAWDAGAEQRRLRRLEQQQAQMASSAASDPQQPAQPMDAPPPSASPSLPAASAQTEPVPVSPDAAQNDDEFADDTGESADFPEPSQQGADFAYHPDDGQGATRGAATCLRLQAR